MNKLTELRLECLRLALQANPNAPAAQVVEAAQALWDWLASISTAGVPDGKQTLRVGV